jgi:hypothetical protein
MGSPCCELNRIAVLAGNNGSDFWLMAGLITEQLRRGKPGNAAPAAYTGRQNSRAIFIAVPGSPLPIFLLSRHFPILMPMLAELTAPFLKQRP